MNRAIRAFDRADRYDAHAATQHAVAQSLADRIAALDLPRVPHVLEIGCGTGFLTEALLPRIGGLWTVTDLAPAMIDRCRARIGERGDVRFRTMDGERPDLPHGSFDLICSSLAFQWFTDLSGAIGKLTRLLAPGGRLVFATMAESSFAEWRRAFADARLPAATPDYPSAEVLAAMIPGDAQGGFSEETFVERHADARAFLAALRGIGAQSPRAGHRPLPIANLRRVMAAFDASGAGVTYHVAYGVITRTAVPREAAA